MCVCVCVCVCACALVCVWLVPFLTYTRRVQAPAWILQSHSGECFFSRIPSASVIIKEITAKLIHLIYSSICLSENHIH